MVDWLGGRFVGSWNKFGYLMMSYIFGVLGFGLIVMVSLLVISFGETSELVFGPMALVALLVFFWVMGVLWQRTNNWIKVFNFKADIVVQVIDNVLRNERILYRRLSRDGPVKRFPVNYAEVFVIENSKTEILVEKHMSTGTFVGIGPVYGNPDGRVEYLKERIDIAFLPKGLGPTAPETAA
jgi:hypothetical protein